jgi:hypothetical protein
MLQEWSADSNYVHKMVVKGEWLLVLVWLQVAEDEEIDTTKAGIHVLKQSDLVEESLFHGNFRCMACFENCEYAVASDETQGINIFSIEDGWLPRSYTVVLLPLTVLAGGCWYLHHWFISWLVLSTSSELHLLMYSISTGENGRDAYSLRRMTHSPVRHSFRVPLHPMIEKTSVPCISHNMKDPCQLLKHF